jgi:hypothetical protein
VSLAGIKAAIVASLSTCVTRVYSQLPESVNERTCALVLPKSGTFHMDAGGNMNHYLEVTILTNRAGDVEQGQEELDPLLDAESVCAAIESANLSTHAHDVMVTGYRDYGGMQYGQGQFLGLKFDITVIA